MKRLDDATRPENAVQVRSEAEAEDSLASWMAGLRVGDEADIDARTGGEFSSDRFFDNSHLYRCSHCGNPSAALRKCSGCGRAR